MPMGAGRSTRGSLSRRSSLTSTKTSTSTVRGRTDAKSWAPPLHARAFAALMSGSRPTPMKPRPSMGSILVRSYRLAHPIVPPWHGEEPQLPFFHAWRALTCTRTFWGTPLSRRRRPMLHVWGGDPLMGTPPPTIRAGALRRSPAVPHHAPCWMRCTRCVRKLTRLLQIAELRAMSRESQLGRARHVLEWSERGKTVGPCDKAQ
mmetsp:Transcript_16431/g.47085  ORF Transcript_16431/g.47085 Transcript_16431/m.47085 type:complete len:204 (-) Transcript_16431:4-615(-)